MQDVEDEPLFAERVAGSTSPRPGSRSPSGAERYHCRAAPAGTRSFRTTRKELLALADWLRSWA